MGPAQLQAGTVHSVVHWKHPISYREGWETRKMYVELSRMTCHLGYLRPYVMWVRIGYWAQALSIENTPLRSQGWECLYIWFNHHLIQFWCSILLPLVYHINWDTECSKGEQEGKHYFYENRGFISPQCNHPYSDYLGGSVILYSSCYIITRLIPWCGSAGEVKWYDGGHGKMSEKMRRLWKHIKKVK